MTAPIAIDDRTEWLEADGLGGFAFRNHGRFADPPLPRALLAATTPPTGRMVFVDGLEAWSTPGGIGTSHTPAYTPGVDVPDRRHRGSFPMSPGRWTWRFATESESNKRSASPKDRLP